MIKKPKFNIRFAPMPSQVEREFRMLIALAAEQLAREQIASIQADVSTQSPEADNSSTHKHLQDH
jgi:hypothetical protein